MEKGIDKAMGLLIIYNMQILEQSSKKYERTYAPIRKDGCAFQVASLQVRSSFWEIEP